MRHEKNATPVSLQVAAFNPVWGGGGQFPDSGIDVYPRRVLFISTVLQFSQVTTNAGALRGWE